MPIIKAIARWILGTLYRVEVRGLEHYEDAGERVLIVANHTSFLDALLLAAFLPERLTFAVNSDVARRWWVRPAELLVRFFPMDPTNPMSVKSLVQHLREDRKAVIFPEGRITVTGALMKIYSGTGLVADKADATVLPVRIDGAQYTPFSRLRGRVRLRWFPKITLTLLPPRRLPVPGSAQGRERRTEAGKALGELMTEMMFQTSSYRRTLFQALVDARRVHGGRHRIAEDVDRRSLTYNQLLTRAFVLGEHMAAETERGEYVGLLLPNATTTLTAFFALQAYGRVPAMLNFSVGEQAVRQAVATADIGVVYTSRRFVETAKLEALVEAIGAHARVVYLEDIAASIGPGNKLKGWLAARVPGLYHRHKAGVRVPDDPAAVLFTSGSEGSPKGVVLSHANLLANREQIAARVDFNERDVILNALPLFHSFGLTAATLLPVLSGMKVFFYPSPLHYRIVPEIAYATNATVLFGTNTFLAGYARSAHPYDFYSVRYVFAGAEKLQDETRRMWAEKFGIRIFEGYGATETSPVIASNTAMACRIGSVGRLLPGIEAHLEAVPGIEAGGRLYVRGPNVMCGYLLADDPGVVQPPNSELGPGWYDTGDIVRFDDDGYAWILGRAKRFAKVGGEMVSLAAVEGLAERTWPDHRHAVVTVADPQKGEQMVLVTENGAAARRPLLEQAKAEGMGEINVPRHVVTINALPVTGTGKIDYPAVEGLVGQELSEEEEAEA